MTSNDVKIENLTSEALTDPRNQLKSWLKSIKRGTVVVYKPNIGDFMCFQCNFVKIYVKNDVKWRQNRKIYILAKSWPQKLTKVIT